MQAPVQAAQPRQRPPPARRQGQPPPRRLRQQLWHRSTGSSLTNSSPWCLPSRTGQEGWSSGHTRLSCHRAASGNARRCSVVVSWLLWLKRTMQVCCSLSSWPCSTACHSAALRSACLVSGLCVSSSAVTNACCCACLGILAEHRHLIPWQTACRYQNAVAHAVLMRSLPIAMQLTVRQTTRQLMKQPGPHLEAAARGGTLHLWTWMRRWRKPWSRR